jgi:holo-[acyl-carrier protein] synthase
MHYIGIDIIEIPRIKKALDKQGEKFMRRVYTDREIELYQGHTASLAARFAAKEAAMKALNAAGSGIGFRDIEILEDPNGSPTVTLYGVARQLAQKLGIGSLVVSLSHSRANAIAIVLAD